MDKNEPIQLCRDEECTGCRACFNACKAKAISMEEDGEGFLRPHIDAAKCLHCRACMKACPILRQPVRERSLASDTVQAAVSKTPAIVKASSSGGLFTELARIVLSHQGVVFGAAWKENLDGIEHVSIEKEEELGRLRGSKYLQSDISSSYSEAKRLLQRGREVFFCGTPCQIAGLHKFLGKEYEGLYTIDIVCHGVPSPRIFGAYKAWLEKKRGSAMVSFSFRDKKWSWYRYNVTAEFSARKPYFGKWEQDVYMRGFLRNYFLRPSCHVCPFAGAKRFSDITLSDFWGYSPEQAGADGIPDDNTGISMVMINTEQGKKLFAECRHIAHCTVPREMAVRCNPALQAPFPASALREDFWRDYRERGFGYVASKYCRPEPMTWEMRCLYLCGAQSRTLSVFRRLKRLTQRVRGSLLYRYHKYFCR